MRPEAEWRISIKHKSGRKFKVELVRHPSKPWRRWRVRMNGRWSKAHPDVSITEFYVIMRTWVVKVTKEVQEMEKKA